MYLILRKLNFRLKEHHVHIRELKQQSLQQNFGLTSNKIRMLVPFDMFERLWALKYTYLATLLSMIGKEIGWLELRSTVTLCMNIRTCRKGHLVSYNFFRFCTSESKWNSKITAFENKCNGRILPGSRVQRQTNECPRNDTKLILTIRLG